MKWKFWEKNNKTVKTKYGDVLEWIDTGDYGLNRIISSDIHKGIPSGRIIIIGGESRLSKR